MSTPELFQVIEEYYDTAPRAAALVEEVGPFTLFRQRDPGGWPYYSRPRLGLDTTFRTADVATVRARQRELGVPESFEWVHETTPSLLESARGVGLSVAQCPLLVLPADGFDADTPVRVSKDLGSVHNLGVVTLGSARLGEVLGAINAGFGETDVFAASDPRHVTSLMQRELLTMVGAYDEQGATGGGSHSPRGSTTELTGIAVLPRARRQGLGAAITHALVADAVGRGIDTVFLSAQDEAVARVYERIGFIRIGTACVAEPVRIERVDGSEWASWRDLRLRALLDSPDAFGSTYQREAAFTESDFRDRLKADEPSVLAMAGPTPVGMGAGFRDVEGSLKVVAMWVDPAWRGCRIGSSILEFIIEWARAHGLRAHLDVNTKNPMARRIYERQGFVGTGDTQPLRPGSPELIEAMELPS